MLSWMTTRLPSLRRIFPQSSARYIFTCLKSPGRNSVRQMVVPTGRAASGYELPSTGFTGVLGMRPLE